MCACRLSEAAFQNLRYLNSFRFNLKTHLCHEAFGTILYIPYLTYNFHKLDLLIGQVKERIWQLKDIVEGSLVETWSRIQPHAWANKTTRVCRFGQNRKIARSLFLYNYFCFCFPLVPLLLPLGRASFLTKFKVLCILILVFVCI